MDSSPTGGAPFKSPPVVLSARNDWTDVGASSLRSLSFSEVTHGSSPDTDPADIFDAPVSLPLRRGFFCRPVLSRSGRIAGKKFFLKRKTPPPLKNFFQHPAANVRDGTA